MTLMGSKSSTPNLDLFKRRNSVSLTACWARFSDFCSSGSSLRDSSSRWSLSVRKQEWNKITFLEPRGKILLARFFVKSEYSPLFSFQMLWDQVTVVVLQGHFSLGGFVPRVRTESEAVGGRHHATRGLGGGEHTCKRQRTKSSDVVHWYYLKKTLTFASQRVCVWTLVMHYKICREQKLCARPTFVCIRYVFPRTKDLTIIHEENSLWCSR